jgi:hypothetical protein
MTEIPLSPPNFFITQHKAEDRINKSYASYISALTIQHRPPVEWTQDASKLIVSNLIKETWKPRWSADYIVWQMEKTDTRPR